MPESQDHERQRHHVYQQDFFDKNVEFFTRPIPEDVEQRTELIVSQVGLSEHSRLLDVGTGTGVLIKHFLAHGVQPHNIVGCDLSKQMMEQAKAKSPGSSFWLGDVSELPSEFGKFDAIFFNACFANLYDPKATVGIVRSRLNTGGHIVISQPVGRQFVEQLHHFEPQLVPHHLPSNDELVSWCREFKLSLSHFRDEGKFYLAILSSD